MIVCVCTGINDREIRAAAASGVRRCVDIFRDRGCTPSCGSCLELISGMLGESGPGDRSAIQAPVLSTPA